MSDHGSRRVLLASVSLSALTITAAAAAPLGPAPFSPAWFAARVDASTGAAAIGSPTATLNQVTTASRNLATLAARLQQMQSAQAAATAAAISMAATNAVPNGLVMGGLVMAPAATPGAPSGSPLWQGANAPTETLTAAGRTAVTIQQTQKQALLNWQQFNVGAKTDLTFDQSAGGTAASGWVILNRVQDPNLAPSQILGSISALGKVFVINPNGILFGAGSQVNVNSLIASTAAISDTQYAAGLYGAVSGTSFLPTFTGAALGSQVTVNQGAIITTAAPVGVTSSGGYVMLLGGAVENDGAITTASGQTILAGGQDFILQPGYSTTTNQSATVLGTQIASIVPAGSTGPAAGTAINNGLIQAPHGDITLLGHAVTQAGVALSTTSVNTRGSIHLLNDMTDTTGSITLTPTSVTSVNPDNAATTALDSQRTTLIAQAAADNTLRLSLFGSTFTPKLNDAGPLADRLDLSRVEITTGGTVAFQPSSLTLSQGGQIAVSAAGRAWIGAGAALDVSGSTSAILPMSSNTVSVNIQGNELRDSPINRDTGLLNSNTVTLDIRKLVQVPASAADQNARTYTAGGLLEVGGYVANTGHTIDEWAALGGTITLAANEVVAQPQADLDIAGGTVAVAGGSIAQSYLIGADGTLYNVNTAPANIRYTGVYGGFVVDHPRWAITQVFSSSLAAAASIAQSGYSYGRDAGQILLQTPTALFEATVEAGVSNSPTQTAARPANATDGYATSQTTIAQPGSLAIGGLDATSQPLAPNFLASSGFAPAAEAVAIDTPIDPALANTANFSASQLTAEALGGLSVVTSGTAAITAPLTLAPGGHLTLQAGTVTVAASVTARGGGIALADIVPVNGVAVPLLPRAQAGGVFVTNGATLDLRGQFTNAAQTPGNVAGEGLVNGGNVAIDSVRTLLIEAGTVIDTSSGGAILPGGKQLGGTGGNVSVTGFDPLYKTIVDEPIAFGATIRGYGVKGGGSFSLTAPTIVVGPAGTPAPTETLVLSPALFSTGFSHYAIDGAQHLDVTPGTVIQATAPVFAFFGSAFGGAANAPTGEDPASAFALILPPLYTDNQATARLTQRQGASLAFISNIQPGQVDVGGGPITIGAGAAITVDPGQSVRIEAFGQITDDGHITAPGGAVAIINTSAHYGSTPVPLIPTLSLSIWLGADSAIDVAGLATTAQDQFGRSYGTVTPGGSITIGSDGGVDSYGLLSTRAALVIRPGASLIASGASASLDLAAGTALVPGLPLTRQPVLVATNGGAISLSSEAGLFLDGALQAASGGPGAAGGSLSLVLESPFVGINLLEPNALLVPRLLTISDTATSLLGAKALAPGQQLPLPSYAQGAISQQQVDAGGFGTLSFYARDAVIFTGDVALHAPQAITLNTGIIADTATTAAVSVSAPLVQLNGYTQGSVGSPPTINDTQWHPFQGNSLGQGPSLGSFTVNADLVQTSASVKFGVSATLNRPAVNKPAPLTNLPGFAEVTLNSTGDIRFDTGTINTPGNVTLNAAQLTPITGAIAAIYAGYDGYRANPVNIYQRTGTITVTASGPTPAAPDFVGGSLSLYAGSIIQAGVIRAPMGTISLGGVGVVPPRSNVIRGGSPFTYSVDLRPGSITSVSMAGQTIPYGGTVDGVSYSYNGLLNPFFRPDLALASQTQTIEAGAVVDLSGGGTLAGAGFITGRGGSVNVLTTPSLVFTAGTVTAPTLAAAPVYAILPSYASAYAPITPVEASASYGAVPALGSQITIGAGVPGLAAGTYTLLPAYFALLPGGERVQIDTGTGSTLATLPTPVDLGAGATLVNATLSIANAAIAPATPVSVILTSQAGVTASAQFNQQDYSTFQLAQSAQYGNPRPALPADAKTLDLIYPTRAATVTAFQNAGQILFAPAPGGHGGQARIQGGSTADASIEITADGATPTTGTTSIDASALNALGAARLVIGGVLTPQPSQPNILQLQGLAAEVAIRTGAVLRAPEILLTARANSSLHATGAVTVESGATVTTIGAGPPPVDSSNGYYYSDAGYTTLALSNGRLTFLPDTTGSASSGPITIADGAALLSGGTLNFITGNSLALGTNASYAARYLSISLDNLNVVGTLAAGTAPPVLPAGFSLTQPVLNSLLLGDPSRGLPALQALTLTANKSVNLIGTVTLNTLGSGTGASLQDFTLNTPAIYGYGAATDVATITTGTLYWNGIESFDPAGNSSAIPGGVITGGPGNGLGNLAITAETIVLGHGPNSNPDDQVTLDRLIEGFANVTLTASTSITASARGSLAIYQTPATRFATAGTGGNLTLLTPLLTGMAGSIDGLTAGGALTLAAAPGQTAATATLGALGAEIDLNAGAGIQANSTILLNSGRLTATAATGDLALGPAARIDLAGVAVPLLDQTAYSAGGSLVLTSALGNILTDPASSIDLSAVGNAAGALQATATAGAATFAGAIRGTAGANHPTGSFTLRAATLPATLADFAALNATLDAGGLYQSRAIELGQGDLAIAGTITAHTIDIAVDSGSLTVTGTLNASGPAPGAITLAAGLNLLLATGALLDAHGTAPQTDSAGNPIESENRAIVSLTTNAGTLTLQNATIDVRSAVPTTFGPALFGQVSFNAPRLLANGVEQGAIAIAAPGPLTILGAQTIALYGSRTYQATDIHGSITQHTDPTTPGSVSLDQLNTDNQAFIAAAAANPTLAASTAGLAAYGPAYHLRPADRIESSTASAGSLTVNGDLDLSTLRYGQGANATPGAGEAGLLSLRAAATLTVNGSITDGFATPPDAATPTPDDKGWKLLANEPLGQTVTIPLDLPAAMLPVIDSYTTFTTGNGQALNYPISIFSATLNANVVLPAPVVLQTGFTIPAGGLTATGTITGLSGKVFAVPGQVLPAGTKIPGGAKLGTGMVLPFQITVANDTVWPAGAKLSAFADNNITLDILSGNGLTLAPGAIIPSGTSITFHNGHASASLRPLGPNGQQGLIYATAAMLPAGSQSWSFNLVGGANLASADLLAIQPATLLTTLSTRKTDPVGSVVFSDTHYTLAKNTFARNLLTASFSVVRTGTGTLNVVAGGSVDEASLFGVYTAGTQTSLGTSQDAQFQTARATLADGSVLGAQYAATYGADIAAYQAYYPDHGGNVLVSAQASVLGDVVGYNSGNNNAPGTDSVGDWLWRQGGAGIGQSASWWINFGSYAIEHDVSEGTAKNSSPFLTGFTGIGALGGGNVTVVAGGDAGEITGINTTSVPVSQGLVIAVGDSGRVTSVAGSPGAITAGNTVLTGGGALTLDVAGTLNPALTTLGSPGAGGTLTDLRGNITANAGQIGRVDLAYGSNVTDPRPQNPFNAGSAVSTNGLILVQGDGTAQLNAMRDLVLAGAGDPGRLPQQNLTVLDPAYVPAAAKPGTIAGDTGFSLWTASTAISLFSAGGNLTPTTAAVDPTSSVIANDMSTDGRFIYPPSLSATAASGSFYYGAQGSNGNAVSTTSLELAPSAIGQLEFLAAGSIYANGYAIDMSGAPAGLNVLSNPYNPAFTNEPGNAAAPGAITNFLIDAGHPKTAVELFAYGADTPTGDLHAGDTQPARFYAVTGDLVDFQFGEVLSFPASTKENPSTWYIAAKPALIIAAQDIVSSGTRVQAVNATSSVFATFPNEASAGLAYSSGNLLLNNTPTDISVVSAGRDILSSYFYIAGPGLLEVDAGRNIDQTGNNNLNFGVLKSLGPIVDINPTGRSGGAGIAVLAGAGSVAPDYSAFSSLYLNPANQANLAVPLSDPSNAGKVQQTYQDALTAWLAANYGITVMPADALAAFTALPPTAQAEFVRAVFFDELRASGRQQSDPGSLFYHSYARGRAAIATLFAGGAYAGNVTMDSGTLPGINLINGQLATLDAGISTLFGGDIQLLTPGGQDILGIAGGPAPGANSGVITFGSGNIDIYALNSVLLGQSRIFTTFGGDILIWSAQGDINAGRGSKTTSVYQPPSILYDPLGGITLAPSAPTTGAGIATLTPIAGTTPGNVDLIAPLGTVDAGEAGIRVSGNLNIAALTVLNAANVQVQGKTTGNTAVATTNVAANAAANAVASSSQNAATNTTAQRLRATTQTPSIITVDVVGYGNDNTDQKRRRPAT